MHQHAHTGTDAALSVRALFDLHVDHAARTYRRRSGQPTREHLNIRASLDRFALFTGPASPAAKINRHQVRAWLDQLAQEQLSRSYVNQCLDRLRRCVRWAADLDYLPASIVADLSLVKALRPLRSPAKERPEPDPPTLETIRHVARFLPPLARAVCQLSTLTAARPSELLELTNAEVHIDAAPRLTPLQHKNAHHGKHRVIALCPAAVAIVERWHRPFCPSDALFSSARSARGHFTYNGYLQALKRACRQAGVKPFVPYDARRAAARLARAAHGLDAAQALLGHAHARTTEIYAPLPPGEQLTFTHALRATEALQ